VRNQVVLVTGPARGIGEAVARALAARGAILALVGLEGTRLAALAADLGPRHAWAECDVTDQAGLEAAVATLTARLGGLDVVIANAGIAAVGPVAAVPADALARVVDVNLTGVVRTVTVTLPHVSARRGYYLFVSSASSFLAAPGLAVYAATKSGVEHFAATLRYEVAHRGVAVGTVHPSWIDTDLLRGAQTDVPSFRELLPRLPWPLNVVTSAQDCAARMVDAVERRAKTTYVPRALAPLSALRHTLARPPFDRLIRAITAASIPAIEREMNGLSRTQGAVFVERAPDNSGKTNDAR